jgi:hypothetical protein
VEKGKAMDGNGWGHGCGHESVCMLGCVRKVRGVKECMDMVWEKSPIWASAEHGCADVWTV